MSNMPLILPSAAPTASSGAVAATAASAGATATGTGLAGAAVGGSGVGQRASSAVPADFAQALLELRTAGSPVPGVPVGPQLHTTPRGQPLLSAVQTALATNGVAEGEGLPLAGMPLPLSLPTLDPDTGAPSLSLDGLPELGPLEQSSVELAAPTGAELAPFALPLQPLPQQTWLEGVEQPVTSSGGTLGVLAQTTLAPKPALSPLPVEFQPRPGDGLSPVVAPQIASSIPQLAAGAVATANQAQFSLAEAGALVSSIDQSAMNPGQMPTTGLQPNETASQRPAMPGWVSTVSTPVGAPDWDAAMGERVKFMAKNELSFAEIRLTPAQLGPVEVRLTVQNDQAQVTLYATHAATRDALEAALPRLRDMLADAGLTLAGANVSSESFTDQRGREGAARGSAENGQRGSTDNTAQEPAELQTWSWSGGSALDVFA